MHHSKIKGVAIGAALLVGAMALTGFTSNVQSSTKGESAKKTQSVDFLLNTTPGGYNAGFEYAALHGLYKAAGLNVTITPGAGSAVTASLVAAGKAPIGYADPTSTGPLIAKGAPMKNIMTIYQSNPDEVTVLANSTIRSLKGLKGHSLGVPTGGSQTSMLPILLSKNGLQDSEITEVNLPQTSLVQALLQHQVDAILGSTDSYQIQATEQGAKTRNWTFAAYGVPTVSTSVFANTGYLKQHADIAKAFVSASLKGWKAVSANQEAGVSAVSTYFPKVSISKAETEQQLKATLQLVCANGNPYVGKATVAAWNKTQQILSSVNLLPKGTAPTKYYTNQYLPSDSKLQKCSKGQPVTK